MNEQPKNYNEIDDWYKKNSQIKARLDKISYQYDLSYLQFSFLLNISENNCITPTEITENLLINRASVSRILKILQKKNLITKSYGKNTDQRIIEIKITETGIEIVNNIKKELNQLAPTIF